MARLRWADLPGDTQRTLRANMDSPEIDWEGQPQQIDCLTDWLPFDPILDCNKDGYQIVIEAVMRACCCDNCKDNLEFWR